MENGNRTCVGISPRHQPSCCVPCDAVDPYAACHELRPQFCVRKRPVRCCNQDDLLRLHPLRAWLSEGGVEAVTWEEVGGGSPWEGIEERSDRKNRTSEIVDLVMAALD